MVHPELGKHDYFYHPKAKNIDTCQLPISVSGDCGGDDLIKIGVTLDDYG